MPKQAIKKTDADYRDSPVAWFVVLERAREDHNFEAAAQAQRELKRLGVTVRFSRAARPAGGKGGNS